MDPNAKGTCALSMVKAEVGRKTPGSPVSSLLWEQKQHPFVLSKGSARHPARASQSPELAPNGRIVPFAREGYGHGVASPWASRGLEFGNKSRQNGDRNAQGPKTRGEQGWLDVHQEEESQRENDFYAEGAQMA